MAFFAWIFIYTNERTKKNENGFNAKACSDRGLKYIATLRGLIDEEDPEKYLDLAKGVTDKVEFYSRAIPDGTSFVVIDTLKTHPEIVEIYIHREYPTRGNPRNEYLWIWVGFVCRD